MKRIANDLLKSIMMSQDCDSVDAKEWLNEIIAGLKEDLSERELTMRDFHLACQDLEVDYDYIDVLIELVFN